jgi:hypothetical protein
MVFCIIGLVVFAFLGLFSAKYRTYFREAVHCISRQVTLRPCDTKFDEKMKSKISAKLTRVSPGIARFTYRRFALLSWIFFIAMIVSLALFVQGAYNLALYGTCDPYGGNCVVRPGYTINETECVKQYECVPIGCVNNATLCNITYECPPK